MAKKKTSRKAQTTANAKRQTAALNKADPDTPKKKSVRRKERTKNAQAELSRRRASTKARLDKKNKVLNDRRDKEHAAYVIKMERIEAVERDKKKRNAKLRKFKGNSVHNKKKKK